MYMRLIMTVAELMEILKKTDPNKEVILHAPDIDSVLANSDASDYAEYTINKKNVEIDPFGDVIIEL